MEDVDSIINEILREPTQKERREALDLFYDITTFIPETRSSNRSGPGQYVMNMPKERRDKLRHLKSDDVSNMRDINEYYR